MARIRSIKPEFFTDGKIADLSDSTALFFIALWTVADDYGFFELDPHELAMRTGRWRAQDMMKMCWALVRVGLVRCSRRDGVGMVVGWRHQHIKDRRASKWTDKEIAWEEPPDNAPGSRKNGVGEDRKGEERRGVSGAGADSADSVPATTPHRVRKRGAGEGGSVATWEAYSSAYALRHGTAPVRDVMVNSQLAKLVKRLGAEAAPQVAAYYVTHNDWVYVKNKHAVWMLLKDAEKLHTEWATGTQVTSGQARQVEQKANVIDVWGPLIAEAERKQREGA